MTSFSLKAPILALPKNNGKNIKQQFLPALIREINSNLWLVQKIMPWSIYDTMFLYVGQKNKTYFSQFTKKEIQILFQNTHQIFQILSNNTDIKQIIFGININNNNILKRFHFHCLGLTKKEIKKMTKTTDIFPAITKKDLEKINSYLIQNTKIPPKTTIKTFQKGIHITINSPFSFTKRKCFSKLIWDIDNLIKNNFPSYKYSFSLIYKNKKIHLHLSPQSQGVLETINIILKRRSSYKFSKKDNSQRELFFQILHNLPNTIL